MTKIITQYTFILFNIYFISLNAQHLSKKNVTKEPTYLTIPNSNLTGFTSNNSFTNEDCFCNFYNDFDDYSTYVEGLSILAKHERREWFNGQKALLKEEIEDRLGQEFSSFEDAQHEFFKQMSGNLYSQLMLNSARDASINARDESKELYDEKLVPMRIFLRARSSSFDAEGLTYNNKLINNMTYHEKEQLYYDYLNESNDPRNDWRFYNDRYRKIIWVNNNGIFSDHMAQEFADHVNSQSLKNNVALMTAYLIYDWQGQNLLTIPPTTFSGIPIYFPSNHHASLEFDMNNIIDDAPGSSAYPSVPSWVGDENAEKRLYSMTNMHLGNKAANFYEGKTVLSEKAGEFQGNNSFDTNSKNLVKRLAEYFVDEEPFMPSSYWSGTQAWGQDDDRPEQLMNIRLSQNAQTWGLGNFARVLETLGQYPQLDAAKGGLIRQYFDGLHWLDFADGFSDLELGRLFDFDWRGRTFLGLQFSPYANARIIDIEHGDDIYGWDLYRDAFKLEALGALNRGVEVDFEKQVFFHPNCSENNSLNNNGICAQNPILSADCRSFEFYQEPGASVRACGVINLYVSFYAYGVQNGKTGVFEVFVRYPIIYFKAPTYMTNGFAATKTARAVTDAIRATEIWFAANPYATKEQVGLQLDLNLTTHMAFFGGSWSITPPFNIPNPAPYLSSASGPGNCN